jgi:hypothetical protein
MSPLLQLYRSSHALQFRWQCVKSGNNENVECLCPGCNKVSFYREMMSAWF